MLFYHVEINKITFNNKLELWFVQKHTYEKTDICLTYCITRVMFEIVYYISLDDFFSFFSNYIRLTHPLQQEFVFYFADSLNFQFKKELEILLRSLLCSGKNI